MPEKGTRLHTATTKSRSGEKCKVNTDQNAHEMKSPRPVTAKEVDKISDRLYSAKTKSGAGEHCKFEPMVAIDQVGRSDMKSKEVRSSTARLSAATTKSWSAEPCKFQPTVAEPPNTKLPDYEVDEIVERLNTTHTKSSSAKPCKHNPIEADNSIAHKAETEEEVKEIFTRLQTSHTKSSSGGKECKSFDELPTPGLGQKCLPNIDGLKGRFKGSKSVKNTEAESIFTRLTSASTRSSRARGEFSKILLYPERTLLCNDFSRITAYQQTGEVVKQSALARRDKWFV